MMLSEIAEAFVALVVSIYVDLKYKLLLLWVFSFYTDDIMKQIWDYFG